MYDLLEVVISWEVKNKYALKNANGQQVGLNLVRSHTTSIRLFAASSDTSTSDILKQAIWK